VVDAATVRILLTVTADLVVVVQVTFAPLVLELQDHHVKDTTVDLVQQTAQTLQAEVAVVLAHQDRASLEAPVVTVELDFHTQLELAARSFTLPAVAEDQHKMVVLVD